MEFIEEIGLNALLDNNRGAKLRNGHKSDNKFHKDNMNYVYDGDYFICYNKQNLTYQKTRIRWNKKKADYEINREYYNKRSLFPMSI